MVVDDTWSWARPGGDGPDVPDGEVIRQSLAAPERFGEVYRRHAAAVHGFAVGRVGPEGAEDVTSESFIIAFRIRHRFDPDRASARPWLLGIAVRQIGHRWRAERAYYRMVASLPPAPPDEGPADLVADAVVAQALRRPLARALAGLRPSDRDVLLLIAWADLTYEETAEALRMPVGTVRSRLHRARQVLRSALADLQLADLPEAEGSTGHEELPGQQGSAGRERSAAGRPGGQDRTEGRTRWTR